MTASSDRFVTVRVALPAHLRNLAGVDGEIRVEVKAKGETEVEARAGEIDRRGGTGGLAPSTTDLMDALEARYPPLRGTIRDRRTGRRRDYMRYFACGEDISFESPDDPLPEPVVAGDEVFRVVGAIAGG